MLLMSALRSRRMWKIKLSWETLYFFMFAVKFLNLRANMLKPSKIGLGYP